MSFYRRAFRLMQHVTTSYGVLIVWYIVAIGVFYHSYHHYSTRPEFYYLREILGISLSISRGSAAVLNISCLMIIIPTCKAMTRVVCMTLPRALISPVTDMPKTCHLSTVYTIIVASGIHTCSHVVNAVNYSNNLSKDFPQLNVASYPGENPVSVLFYSFPGVTGLSLLILLLVLCITSMTSIRRRCYEVFQYCHYLALPFLVILIIHPLGGLLKQQTNLADHPPGCSLRQKRSEDAVTSQLQPISKEIKLPFTGWKNYPGVTNLTNFKTRRRKIVANFDRETLLVLFNTTIPVRITCDTTAQFSSIQSYTWVWVGVSLILWMIEASIRAYMGKEKVTLVSVIAYPGQILQLKLHKQNLKCSPGQFVLINCREIALHEWHPFTIAIMEEEEEMFNIFMRTDGDWGTALLTLINQKGGFRAVPLSRVLKTPHLTINRNVNVVNSASLDRSNHIPHDRNDNNIENALPTSISSVFSVKVTIEKENALPSHSQHLSRTYRTCNSVVNNKSNNDKYYSSSYREAKRSYIRNINKIFHCPSNKHTEEFSNPTIAFASIYPDVRLNISGPYCSPHQSVTCYPIVIAIVGGLGITPLIAAITHIKKNKPISPKRLHLVWIVRDASIFVPFATVLTSFIQDCWHLNLEDKFELKLHVTSQISDKLVTVLNYNFPLILRRISMGRPKWKDLFKQWRDMYPKEKVGVFSCGPKSLSRQVKKYCISSTARGYHFSFYHDSFS